MLLLHDENSAYEELLCGHLRRFARRLRAIPPEKWEWQPVPAAPSARLLAQHAWLWLVCDQEEICALLEAECEAWRALLRGMTAERLGEERQAFNWRRVNARWLVWHMCQNVIYKHGQLATLSFQLGLDGEEPYRAPLPRDDYDRLEEMLSHAAIRRVVCSEAGEPLPDSPDALDERDRAGCTALHYAVWRREVEMVRALLERGAAVDLAYQGGWTALMDAAWLGDADLVTLLLAAGARTDQRSDRGYSALELAREQGHATIVELLKDS
jgi:hypothetical protein